MLCVHTCNKATRTSAPSVTTAKIGSTHHICLIERTCRLSLPVWRVVSAHRKLAALWKGSLFNLEKSEVWSVDARLTTAQGWNIYDESLSYSYIAVSSPQMYLHKDVEGRWAARTGSDTRKLLQKQMEKRWQLFPSKTDNVQILIIDGWEEWRLMHGYGVLSDLDLLTSLPNEWQSSKLFFYWIITFILDM